MFLNQSIGKLSRFTEVRALRWLAWAVSWTGGIYATLSIRHLDFGGGHTFCGPWGCGGATNDLAAVHAAWCIAMTPPIVLLDSKRERLGIWYLRCGAIVLCLGLAGLVAVALHTWLVWLPSAAEYQRGFALQRVGFTVVNLVDIPLVQMTLAGLIVLRNSLRSGVRLVVATGSASYRQYTDMHRQHTPNR